MFVFLCVCVCVCVCVFILIVFRSHSLQLRCIRSTVCAYVSTRVQDCTEQHFPTSKHANCLLAGMQRLFAVLGDCLHLYAWGGSFSLVITERGKDKTAFVISIAPTGSICFITTKAKSVLSGKSCRHPENKTPNKWVKQLSAAVSGEWRMSWMNGERADWWMDGEDERAWRPR